MFFQMRKHLAHWCAGDQAEVTRARRGRESLGFKFVPRLMQVDFLLAESERLAVSLKRDDLHAQHGLVEGAGAIDIRNGEHEMVKTIDFHGVVIF